MSHCAPAVDAARSCWMAASATFTTEPSIKETLDPNTVAASVAAGCIGACAGPPAAAPESCGAATSRLIVWRTAETDKHRGNTSDERPAAGDVGHPSSTPWQRLIWWSNVVSRYRIVVAWRPIPVSKEHSDEPRLRPHRRDPQRNAERARVRGVLEG